MKSKAIFLSCAVSMAVAGAAGAQSVGKPVIPQNTVGSSGLGLPKPPQIKIPGMPTPPSGGGFISGVPTPTFPSNAGSVVGGAANGVGPTGGYQTGLIVPQGPTPMPGAGAQNTSVGGGASMGSNMSGSTTASCANGSVGGGVDAGASVNMGNDKNGGGASINVTNGANVSGGGGLCDNNIVASGSVGGGVGVTAEVSGQKNLGGVTIEQGVSTSVSVGAGANGDFSAGANGVQAGAGFNAGPNVSVTASGQQTSKYGTSGGSAGVDAGGVGAGGSGGVTLANGSVGANLCAQGELGVGVSGCANVGLNTQPVTQLANEAAPVINTIGGHLGLFGLEPAYMEQVDRHLGELLALEV